MITDALYDIWQFALASSGLNFATGFVVGFFAWPIIMWAVLAVFLRDERRRERGARGE